MTRLSNELPGKEDAQRSLDSLTTGAHPSEILRILRTVLPVGGGYLEGFSLAAPNDPSVAAFGHDEEVVATILTSRESDDKIALQFVAQAPPGHFVTEDIIDEEEWDGIGGYQAIREHTTEGVGALKLGQREVNGTTEHLYLALILKPGAGHWTRAYRAILLELHESIRNAYERLSLPLLRRETVLLQLADEQQLGLIVLDENGRPQEANCRGWLLALEASRAKDHQRPEVLTAFVEQLTRVPAHPGSRRRLLELGESGDRLEIWAHHLAPDVYQIPASRTLLVLRKESVLAPEWSSHAARLTEQQRRIAESLAAPGANSSTVAAELELSPRTVETHLQNIYRRLSINSRAELVALMRGR